MTCITCHDPHDVPRGREAVQHYVKVCQSCHPSAHVSGPPTANRSADTNCLECHMPKRRAEDAVHVVVTDHFIQRRRSTRDFLAPLIETVDFQRNAYRGEVALYYPLELPPSAENELYLAVAQVQQSSNLKAGIPRLEQAVEKHRPQTTDFYFELARAYAEAGNHQAAIHWNEEALRHNANFRPALKHLASSLMAAGQLPRAAQMLETAIKLRAADSFALTDLGNVDLRMEKIDEARQVLQKALTFDPDLPETNSLMGLARLKEGDSTAAETYFRNAIRIQPDLAEAHNNLANLLASGKD